MITRHGETGLTFADKLQCGGIVEPGDGETAGHRFGQDVAERLGQTRMNVDVSRGVVAADFFAGEKAGEDALRMLADELGLERTVSGEDKFTAGIGSPHRVKTSKQQAVVFLRGHAADVDDHGVVGRRPPRFAQGGGAFHGVELGGVDAAGEDHHVAEAESGEFGAQLWRGGECATGTIVDVA